MRKRELLIIAAFAAMGMIAYQLTAAPPTEGRRRFSLSNLVNEFRRETAGRRAIAGVTSQGTIEIGADVAEARISGIPNLVVRGEARQDIAYTLKVESGGPDEAAARATAARTVLSEDQLGPILSLTVRSPREGRHVASLSLVVPTRLKLRIEAAQGAGTLDVRDVSDIELDGLGGDVRVANVTGRVSGSHRNGELTVVDAAHVDLSVQNSEAVFERVRDRLRLSARNGHSRIVAAGGPVEVATQNDEIVIQESAAPVRVTGTGGTLTLEQPDDEAHIDLRRAEVSVRLTRAMPLTLLTSDAPLRLELAGEPGVIVDAVTTEGGTITVEPSDVLPEVREHETRLRLVLADDGPVVALRNRRGPIVISRAK